MAEHDYISLQKLQQLASETALTNGLAPARREDISRMYYASEKNQFPIIVRCDVGTLWVDKYYVAYQIEDGDVHYTYISKHHISEEICSYRAASRERDSRINLPPDIMKAFREAHYQMQAKGLPYWIAPSWSEKK